MVGRCFFNACQVLTVSGERCLTNVESKHKMKKKKGKEKPNKILYYTILPCAYQYVKGRNVILYVERKIPFGSVEKHVTIDKNDPFVKLKQKTRNGDKILNSTFHRQEKKDTLLLIALSANLFLLLPVLERETFRILYTCKFYIRFCIENNRPSAKRVKNTSTG